MERLVFNAMVSLAASAIISSAPLQAQTPPAPAATPKEGPKRPAEAKAAKEQGEARPRDIAVEKPDEKHTLEREFADRMRPLVFLEIRFAAAICELSKEQRRSIAKAAKPVVDELAKELTSHEQKQAVPAGPESVANEGIDPQGRVVAALGAIVKTQVSSQRWDRYQHELRKRAADCKRSSIDNLVAELDRELILSPQQRNALAGLLAEEWKEEWSCSLDAVTEPEAWLPPVPERRITPILSELQRKALQKLNVRKPQRWERLGLAAELFELTRTPEEEEIEKAAGFPPAER